jgi:hypothetical protein
MADVSAGFCKSCAQALREMLTGNGLACMGDKDEEQFDRAPRRWVLLAGRKSLRVSSLLRTEGG